MIIDDEEYNFVPTVDPVIAKNYEGFISPEGEFYMVSRKYIHKPSHDEWAIEYVERLIDKLDKNTKSKLSAKIAFYGVQRYLIDINGFIYYSHSTSKSKIKEPIIVYPKKIGLKTKTFITDKQKKMLYNVMVLNHEEKWFPIDIEKELSDRIHDHYVDDFIAKEIKENIKK